jgi:hypothetical protein
VSGASTDHRVRVVELEAERTIAGLGFDPRPIMPLVREAAIENEELDATDIVAILRAENPDSFKAREVATRPADRTLDDFSEREKVEYIGKHGLEAFLKLVDGAGQRRRAEMQRKIRGF